MTRPAPGPVTRIGPGWRAWAGLVLGPGAWALQHQFGSNMNYADCMKGDGVLAAASAAVAFAIALAGALLSLSAWRARGGAPDVGQDQAGRFIALLGVMASSLAALTILVQAMAAVIVPACFR